MQQRTGSKGLSSSPAKVWALLAAALFVFLVTRSLISHDSSATSHLFYNRDALHPTNYLNASAASPAPFAFCPAHGPGDALGQKYGPHVIARSRLHAGSGARVQRVVHKALSGLPVTISVLGGSIASCHGVGDDPLAPNCWPARFFQWWNQAFPHPASQLTNGARRRTNSGYFSFCHGHHLPDETDLVILDFDTEDDSVQPEDMDHFELLVRSILTRPDQPAVIILGHFSPQFQGHYAFHGPEIGHSVVAQFYDVPHISVKGLVYSEYLSNPEPYKTAYHVDPVLANSRGHELLADVLILYFQSQVCAGWSAALGYTFDIPILSGGQNFPTDGKGLFGGIRHIAQEDDGHRKGEEHESSDFNPGPYAALRVPPAKLTSRPHDLAKFREPEPFCVAADDLINPLPPSLFYGSGWHSFHPDKKADVDNSRHYWYSTLPTSKLRVPIKVGLGDIAIYILLEPKKDPADGTSVNCWVDDNYRGAVRVDNYLPASEPARPRMMTIDRNVEKGSHFVECVILGEEGKSVEAFKILGIFST